VDVEISTPDTAAAVTVTLEGDVDVATAPALQRRLDTVLSEGVEDLVVDVSDVPFIDVAGLTVLLRVQYRLSLRGGRLTVLGPSRALEIMTAALGVELLSAAPARPPRLSLP
jgi:anti-sigma B factor antagonist